jgi:hypothetical protein
LNNIEHGRYRKPNQWRRKVTRYQAHLEIVARNKERLPWWFSLVNDDSDFNWLGNHIVLNNYYENQWIKQTGRKLIFYDNWLQKKYIC